MNRPTGELCQHLLSCISPSRNISAADAQTIESRQTFISQLEEFLEKMLLLLGGMGAVGLTHQIIKARTWIRQVPKLLGQAIKKTQTQKQLDAFRETI